MLPDIYATAALAALAQPAAEKAEREAWGETGKDGEPRWARVVPVRMVAPDALAGFDAWEGPEPVHPTGGGPKSASTSTGIGDVAISAVGHVQNP